MSFPRYPAYKDSGVEWLGEVPEHWSLCRTDAVIGSCRSSINADALAQKPVFHYSIPVVQETGDGQLEDGSNIDSGKLVVTEPQVLVSKLNPRKGTVCIARPHDVLTVCSSEFVPLLPRSEDIRFLWYIVQSENYRTRLESLVESATKSHQRAAPSDIYRLMWSFPPRTEQTTIATFLDRETAKIDALIAEQQRLIELLQEKHQAVISHAVTKGLNPDAPMKDSGVEWLGEVPAHWEVIPLMRLTQPSRPVMYGIVLPGPDVGEGVPILKGGNVKPSRLCLEYMARTTPEIEAPFARARLIAGDLVYGIRGSIGDCEIVPIELEGCNITQDVARIAPLNSLCSRWLRYTMLSRPVAERLACGSLGAAVKGINIFDLKRARIPVPPPGEMKCIADFLSSEDSRLLSLSLSSETAIGLMRERRSALISAAVTGQIDVRGLVSEPSAA